MTPGGRIGDEEWRDLEAIPLLGLVAMAAALADLSVNGVAIRSLAETLSHPALLTLSRWGELPRNLAAIAGLVALPAALLGYLRTRRWANVQRRLIIAGFAGIFLPVVALATVLSPDVLPHDERTLKLVKVGVGAANVLAVLLGLVAVRRSAPVGLRIGVALATASCFFAFSSLAMGELRFVAATRIGLLAHIGLRQMGEVTYLMLPISVAISLVPRAPDLRSRLALGAGVASALAIAGVFAWGVVALRSDFAVVLYGAQRTDLLAEVAVWGYALPLAVGFGAGAAGLASTEAGRRQAGAGLLLLLAAGFAPRTPGGLLTMVLGMALLSRASIALGEHAVAGRSQAVLQSAPVDPLD